MIQWTNTLFLTAVLLSIKLCGQTDTTYNRDRTNYYFQRNDTTFYYYYGRLRNINIHLRKKRTKGIDYYRDGKIESIFIMRPNRANDGGFEHAGKWLGFFNDGTIRFKVMFKKNGIRKISYIYYPNGTIQCKTYWDKYTSKKKVITYDENGKKIFINYRPNKSDSSVHECE